MVFLPSMRYGSLSVDRSNQPNFALPDSTSRAQSLIRPLTRQTAAPWSAISLRLISGASCDLLAAHLAPESLEIVAREERLSGRRQTLELSDVVAIVADTALEVSCVGVAHQDSSAFTGRLRRPSFMLQGSDDVRDAAELAAATGPRHRPLEHGSTRGQQHPRQRYLRIAFGGRGTGG